MLQHANRKREEQTRVSYKFPRLAKTVMDHVIQVKPGQFYKDSIYAGLRDWIRKISTKFVKNKCHKMALVTDVTEVL